MISIKVTKDISIKDVLDFAEGTGPFPVALALVMDSSLKRERERGEEWEGEKKRDGEREIFK